MTLLGRGFASHVEEEHSSQYVMSTRRTTDPLSVYISVHCFACGFAMPSRDLTSATIGDDVVDCEGLRASDNKHMCGI